MNAKMLMLVLFMLTRIIDSAETIQEPTNPSGLNLSTPDPSDTPESETTLTHYDGTIQTPVPSASTITFETTLKASGGQTSATDTLATTASENVAKSSIANLQGPGTSVPYVETSLTMNLSVTSEFETTSNISRETIPTSKPSETTRNQSDGNMPTSPDSNTSTKYETTSKFQSGQTSAQDSNTTTPFENKSHSSGAEVHKHNLSATTVSQITLNPSDEHTSTNYLSISTELDTSLNPSGEISHTSNPSEATQKHSGETILNTLIPSIATEYQTTLKPARGQVSTSYQTATTEFENTSNPSGTKLQSPDLYATTVSVQKELATSGESFQPSRPSEATRKHSDGNMSTNTNSITLAYYETTPKLSGEQTFPTVPAATTEFEYSSNPSRTKVQLHNPNATTESIITLNPSEGETSTTNVRLTTGEKMPTSDTSETTENHSGEELPTTTYSSTATENEMTSKISEEKLTTPNISMTTVSENTSKYSNGKRSTSTETTDSKASPNPKPPGQQTPTPYPKNNTTSTTRSVPMTSTPTRREIFTKKPENLELQLSFTVKITQPFTKELNDTTSKPYKKLATDFKAALEISFRTSSGFSHVVIKGFREGSIICEYSAVYKDVKNITALKTEITAVKTIIEKQKVDNVPMAPVHMAEDFTTATSDLCEAYKEPCGKGYTCNSSDAGVIICTSFCAKKENKCQNRGKCSFDVVSSQTDCRCVHDEDYVYSGRYCENKSEKLAMSSTYIIIISSCAGGSIILSLIIVIIVMAVKRKGRGVNKTQYLDDEDDKHRSVSMDEMYPNRFSNPYTSKSRGNTVQNEYQSGLPDTRYVGGRQHRVLTDDTGSETYLYQPFKQPSQSRPASTNSSEPGARSERAGSVYDYIDTDATYQIKRPTFKMGYFNKV